MSEAQPVVCSIINTDGFVAGRWERILRREGWKVAAFPTFSDYFSEVAGPGIALIDWNCLGNGAKSVRAAKAGREVVSILLTSSAPLDDARVIEMLEAGADDYLPQSIRPELFLAKLRAHARRLILLLPQEAGVLKTPRGDLKLDIARRELWIRGHSGRWAETSCLTPTELQLLALFLERPGVALERPAIMDALWRGAEGDIRPGTVDKHVESLRRKLGTLGERIQSIYGVGYAYRDRAGWAPARRRSRAGETR